MFTLIIQVVSKSWFDTAISDSRVKICFSAIPSGVPAWSNAKVKVTGQSFLACLNNDSLVVVDFWAPLYSMIWLNGSIAEDFDPITVDFRVLTPYTRKISST